MSRQPMMAGRTTSNSSHPTFKRHSVLLVAKPELTFIWQTPLLFLDEHPRNKTWTSVGALLSKLRMNDGN